MDSPLRDLSSSRLLQRHGYVDDYSISLYVSLPVVCDYLIRHIASIPIAVVLVMLSREQDHLRGSPFFPSPTIGKGPDLRSDLKNNSVARIVDIPSWFFTISTIHQTTHWDYCDLSAMQEHDL